MTVNELIAEVNRCVPPGARAGTRHRVEGEVTLAHGAHRVAVGARIDPKGQRRDQYSCDGIRVSKVVLLRLTCAEAECPQARAVREQWDLFHRRRSPGRAAGKHAAAQPGPLLLEAEVVAAGHRCLARSARFSCFSPCPNDAHPPLWIDKTGFDLFEGGVCIGGGLVTHDGIHRPRLPSIAAAEAYLLARQWETSALLSQVASRSGE